MSDRPGLQRRLGRFGQPMDFDRCDRIRVARNVDIRLQSAQIGWRRVSATMAIDTKFENQNRKASRNLRLDSARHENDAYMKFLHSLT